jgi:hypothetical protein
MKMETSLASGRWQWPHGCLYWESSSDESESWPANPEAINISPWGETQMWKLPPNMRVQAVAIVVRGSLFAVLRGGWGARGGPGSRRWSDMQESYLSSLAGAGAACPLDHAIAKERAVCSKSPGRRLQVGGCSSEAIKGKGVISERHERQKGFRLAATFVRSENT